MNKLTTQEDLQEAIMQGKLDLRLHSTARSELMREINKQPVLCELITLSGHKDWGDIIGEVAAWCNIILDGSYSQEDLEALYPRLTNKLERFRSPIIQADYTIDQTGTCNDYASSMQQLNLALRLPETKGD
jgi:hypothetical protein